MPTNNPEDSAAILRHGIELPPKIIHEFKKSELVQDMSQVTTRKHWWSRKHTSIYILTSNGIYEMRVK